MLTLFIVYMVLLTLIFASECYVKATKCGMDTNVKKANLLRIFEPLKTLALLFSVSVLELLIQHVFEIITPGFVTATTAILGVAGVVYLADYVWEQYKLRSYDCVLSVVDVKDFGELSENYMLTVRGNVYLKKHAVDYANTLAAEKTKCAVNKIIIKYILLAVVLTTITAFGIILIVSVNTGGIQ